MGGRLYTTHAAGDGVMIVVTTSDEVDLYVREVIVKQGTGVIVTPGEYNQVANCFFQAR